MGNGGTITGTENIGIGYISLGKLTSGGSNVAVGNYAMLYTTSGSNNTAIGLSALQANTTGSISTAVGYQAGYANTTGEITAVGVQALYANTTGSQNTAVGVGALYPNTTGGSNSALGRDALNSNTTGSNNTAVGQRALYYNTTGSQNIALGSQALYSNTTASANIAIGYQAGYSLTTSPSYRNTFVGTYAGYSCTGTSNTFVGAQGASTGSGSGEVVTSGRFNTILGAYSGNQDGLDIRTADSYVVLSDGYGNRQISMAEGQTLALDSAVPNAGTGITFPATQSASSNANTLDDYEEGTFTPYLYADAGSGITYNHQTGKYTKIGNVVHYGYVLGLTSKGTISGSIYLAGLPFEVEGGYSGSAEPWGISISYVGGLATNTVYSINGWSNNQSAIVQLRRQSSADLAYGQAYVNASDISNDFYIQFSGTYRV